MFARRMAVGRLVAIVQAVGVCGAGVIIVNDIHLRMAWQLASVSAVAIAFVHCAHAYVPVMAKPKATVIREMTAANIRSCVGACFLSIMWSLRTSVFKMLGSHRKIMQII